MVTLAGRVAVITGAASGIGASIARCFSNFGADVVLTDIDEAGAEALAGELRSLSRGAIGIGGDVRVQAHVDASIARTLREFGRVDILVNNAGSTLRKRFLDLDENDWHAMLDMNLVQVFRWTRAVAHVMIEQEIPGSLINMTTVEAYRAAPGFAPYAAAKAGLANFTMTMALELAPWDIRVNSIAPDATLTARGDPTRDIADEVAREGVPRHIPRGRRGLPVDYDGAALFLASDLSSWITGEVIHVGGGTRAASGWRRDEQGYWNNGGLPHSYSGRPYPRFPTSDLR
jgi:3-oxoacyl-[acyl-carrier protein] reductase